MAGEVQKALPDLGGLSILLVDDDHAILRSLQRVLRGLGASVTGVSSVREATLSLENVKFDAVFSDLQLKDGKGTELLPDYINHQPEGAFYMVTGHGSVDNAVDTLRQGARHYFEKPIDPIALVEQLARDISNKQTTQTLSQQLSPYLSVADPVMLDALVDIPWYAKSDEPVLINGKSGTGKELVARALHGLSPRSAKPFVAINCGSIPETMLEAELFGHEKGAFTGASSAHKGCFEQTQGGTLFLDEIGEMPLTAQTSLLRVLEQKAIKRVGGEKEIVVDVRIIAATHRNLEESAAAGQFREDLLFRLNVLPLFIPCLRDRPADIEMLASAFLKKQLEQDIKNEGGPVITPVFSDEALAALKAYHWPGNVRELRNMMTRLSVRLPTGLREISAEHIRRLLPKNSSQRTGSVDEGVFILKGTTLADAEWLLIDAALKQADFNRSKAAELLGIGERTLRRKLNGN